MHFVGKHDYSLDRKRVPIPPPYRGAFSAGGFVTTGIGPYLVLHTMESWDRACSVIEQHPIDSEEGGDVHRDFFSNAALITPDAQGRIQIPDALIEHAGLDREVRVVGTGPRLEIWDRATFLELEPRIQAARRAAFGRASVESRSGDEQ